MEHSEPELNGLFDKLAASYNERLKRLSTGSIAMIYPRNINAMRIVDGLRYNYLSEHILMSIGNGELLANLGEIVRAMKSRQLEDNTGLLIVGEINCASAIEIKGIEKVPKNKPYYQKNSKGKSKRF